MELKQYDKMSWFIRDAVADSRKLDRTIYWPASGMWHGQTYPAAIHPPTKRYCLVCFAGAVLAGHIPPDVLVDHPKLLTETGYEEFRFTHLQIDILLSLEMLRTGRFIDALSLVVGPTLQLNDTQLRTVGEMENDYLVGVDDCLRVKSQFEGWLPFDLFLNGMEALADKLEAVDL